MKRTYKQRHQLVAYIVIVSLFLQSCGGFHNSIIPIQKEAIDHLEPKAITSSIPLASLVGQELIAHGGHAVTLYEEAGKLKADVVVNTPQGFSKDYKSLEVGVEQGAALSYLANLDKKGQERCIHLHLAKGEQPAKIVIYKRSGLMGGMKSQGEEKGKERIVEGEEAYTLLQDEHIPAECFCPITQEIMEDPVIAQDGHTYERAAIQQWFGIGRRTSPKTGARLLSIELISNYTMRSLIQDLKAQIPVLARHELNLNNIEAAIKLREEDMQQELELKGGLLQEQQQRVAYLEAQLAELAALQKQTSQLTLSGRTAHGSVTFYGQPGVGKSTLANSIFEEAIFESGTSLAGPITTHKQAQQHGGILYIDTPALDNVEVRKKAAEDIEEALKSNENYKVAFVLTLDNGKLRPVDLVSIGTVCDAVRMPFHYGLIFNKVEKDIMEKIREEGGIGKYLAHLKKQPASTLLLEKDLTIEGKKNAHLPTDSESRKNLVKFISDLRANNVPNTTQGDMYARISREREEKQRTRQEERERQEREKEQDRKILAKLTIDKYFWRHATKKDIDWNNLTLPKVLYSYPKLKQAEIVAGYYRRLLYDESCKYGGQLVLARTCYKRNRFEKLLSPEQMGFMRIEPTCFQDPNYDKQLIRYLRDDLLTLVSLTVQHVNPLFATMLVKNNTNEDIDFIIDKGTVLEQTRFRNVQNVVVTHLMTNFEHKTGSQKPSYTLRDLYRPAEEGSFTARIKAKSQETIRVKCQCIDQGSKFPSASGEPANITPIKRTEGINKDPEANVTTPLPGEHPSWAQEILDNPDMAAKSTYDGL